MRWLTDYKDHTGFRSLHTLCGTGRNIPASSPPVAPSITPGEKHAEEQEQEEEEEEEDSTQREKALAGKTQEENAILGCCSSLTSAPISTANCDQTFGLLFSPMRGA